MYQLEPPPPVRRSGSAVGIVLAILGLFAFGVIALVVIGVVLLRSGAWLPGATGRQAEYWRHNREGNRYYAARAFKPALREYAAMVRLYPNSPEGYFFEGMTYSRLGEYDRAIEQFNLALSRSRSPRARADAHYNIAIAFRRKNDWQDSVNEFTESIDEAATSDAYYWRADAYLLGGKYRDAAADLTRYIQLRPSDVSGYGYRAEVYRRAREYAKAVADGQQTVRLQPGNATFWGNLSWTQYLNRQLPDAIRSNDRCLALDPSLSFARLNQGLYFAVQGNWPASQKEYATAVAHSGRADLKAGLKDVEDALRLQPTSPTLRQAEAMLKPAAGA